MLNYFILRLISMRCASANNNFKLSMHSDKVNATQMNPLYHCIPAESSKDLLSLATSSERTTALYLSQPISKDYTSHDILQRYEAANEEGNSVLGFLSSEEKYKSIPETSRLYLFHTGYSIDNDNPMISHLAASNSTQHMFKVIIKESEKSKDFYNNMTQISQNEVGKNTNKLLYQNERPEYTSTHSNPIELLSNMYCNNSLSIENMTYTLPKPVLERKVESTQKVETCKKQRMLNESILEPSQNEGLNLKMLLKSRYNDNINRSIISSSNMFSCQFFKKYNAFIARIEILLEIFLSLTLEEEKSVDVVLFTEDFSILNGFSFDLFGNINMKQPDILKKASSTADMLVKFFEILDFEDFEDLIFELKKCLELKDESNVEVEISSRLLSDIFSYLGSEESRYLKSISVEFFSFVYKFNELAIFHDKNIIKALAMFLILVKRNNLVIPKLKQTQIESNHRRNIRYDFKNEVVFGSSLFFVFIKYLPCSNPGNTLQNMCTSILFNCISDEISEIKGSDLLHYDVINILRYVFFYLMEFTVFEDYSKIFEFKQTPEKPTSKFQNLNTHSKEIHLHIQNEFPNIVKRIKAEINFKRLEETEYFKIYQVEEDLNEFKIYRLQLLLEYIYTFSTYFDYMKKP